MNHATAVDAAAGEFPPNELLMEREIFLFLFGFPFFLIPPC